MWHEICYACMNDRGKVQTSAIFFVCGQTQSSKSYIVFRMLHNLKELFYPIPTKIIYCYGEYQKEFDKLPPKVELVEGFPNSLSDMVRNHLDNFMTQCSNNQWVAHLFTHSSHHCGISIVYLTQNLFLPGKLSCMISLNSHYMIIF